jgi:UDP-glucose 4-epimerase
MSFSHAAFQVADPTAAREVLKFRAEHSDLGAIIRTAWAWHRKGSPAENGTMN